MVLSSAGLNRTWAQTRSDPARASQQCIWWMNARTTDDGSEKSGVAVDIVWSLQESPPRPRRAYGGVGSSTTAKSPVGGAGGGCSTGIGVVSLAGPAFSVTGTPLIRRLLTHQAVNAKWSVALNASAVPLAIPLIVIPAIDPLNVHTSSGVPK